MNTFEGELVLIALVTGEVWEMFCLGAEKISAASFDHRESNWQYCGLWHRGEEISNSNVVKFGMPMRSCDCAFSFGLNVLVEPPEQDICGYRDPSLILL